VHRKANLDRIVAQVRQSWGINSSKVGHRTWRRVVNSRVHRVKRR
jgi:hypothetical protein